MAFTCFDKFGEALELLNDEDRALVSKAILEYGLLGVEPELPYHLAWAFPLIREPIDKSHEAQASGRKGGRPKKTEVSETQKAPFSENENHPFEREETGVSEKPKAHTRPYQTIPNQTKKKYGAFSNVELTDDELEKLQKKFPDWKRKIDDLSAYIASKGKRYKSHYATILTWARRDEPKEAVVHDEYSTL